MKCLFTVHYNHHVSVFPKATQLSQNEALQQDQAETEIDVSTEEMDSFLNSPAWEEIDEHCDLSKEDVENILSSQNGMHAWLCEQYELKQ